MDVVIENVTPKKAEAWLNANNTNRKLREGVVEKYAADMAAGRWTQCSAPIAFYADGDVADGQHRLFAICETGIPQRFVIMRGLSREDGLNIDTGLGRSLIDNARISGQDTDLSNEIIALARAVEQGDRQKGALSNAQRLELVEKHREACKWATSNGMRGRGLRSQLTLAAVARAFYYEKDLDKLKRFCEVVTNGFSNGKHEAAAIAIRNYMLTGSGARVGSSAALWRETFLKIQNAIRYFMLDKPLVVIKGVADEAYPLPKTRK